MKRSPRRPEGDEERLTRGGCQVRSAGSASTAPADRASAYGAEQAGARGRHRNRPDQVWQNLEGENSATRQTHWRPALAASLYIPT